MYILMRTHVSTMILSTLLVLARKIHEKGCSDIQVAL